MTKPEFLSEIAKKSGQTVKDVKSVLKHFQVVLLEELKKEKRVNFLDMGQFKVSERSARTGVNPRSKEKIQIPARIVPKLVPSRKFKEFVAGSLGIGEFDY